MTDPSPDLSFNAAADAMAVVNALMLMPGETPDKHSDEAIQAIMEIVKGKNWLEVIALVVQLGGFTNETVQTLCKERGLDPREHMQRMAMDMHTRRHGDEDD